MIEKLIGELIDEVKGLRADIAAGGMQSAKTDTTETVVEDDLTGGPEPSVTLADVLDATSKAAGRNREKTIALLAKYKVKKAAELKEGDFVKYVAEAAKIK